MPPVSRAPAPPPPWCAVLCWQRQFSLNRGEHAGRRGQLRVTGDRTAVPPDHHDRQGQHPLDGREHAGRWVQLHILPDGGERAGRRGQLHVAGEHTPARATAPAPSLTPTKPVSSLASPPTTPVFSSAQRVPVPFPDPRATLHAPTLPPPATAPAPSPRGREAPPRSRASTHGQDGWRIFSPLPHSPYFLSTCCCCCW